MARVNVDILLNICIVHEGKYAGSIHTFIFFGSGLLLALSVQVGDIGASVGEYSFNVVGNVEAFGTISEYSAYLLVGLVLLLGNVVVVLQELHGVVGEFEVRIALVSQGAGVFDQETF